MYLIYCTSFLHSWERWIESIEPYYIFHQRLIKNRPYDKESVNIFDIPVVLARFPDWFISWKSWLFRILHASIQRKSCKHRFLMFWAQKIGVSCIFHHPILRVLYILKDVWKYISASTSKIYTAQSNIYVKPRMAWNHSGPAGWVSVQPTWDPICTPGFHTAIWNKQGTFGDPHLPQFGLMSSPIPKFVCIYNICQFKPPILIDWIIKSLILAGSIHTF